MAGFDFGSWLFGVVTGIGVNWLSQWSYDRFIRKKKPKGDYFNVSYSDDSLDVQGSFKTDKSAQELFAKAVKEFVKSGTSTIKEVVKSDTFAEATPLSFGEPQAPSGESSPPSEKGSTS